VEEGRLRIDQEGKVNKFIEQVEHVTFSGTYALTKNQPVLYVTERCVFSLTREGMVLTEVAPGLDLEKDILARMDFDPIIEEAPRVMDERLFRSEPMGLKDLLLNVPLAERLSYDPGENILFVNFEGFSVRTREDVEAIRKAVVNMIVPLKRRVYTIVNYDSFSISPEIVDEYSDMVKFLVDHYYSGVTRYTTSTFLRMKLGDALQKRDVSPHIYESREEAQWALRDA
jgi:propionate CoA-transferase